MAGVHDHTASVLSLARVMLAGIDPRQENTMVKSAALILIINTLLEIGAPGQTARVSEVNNNVRSIMESFNAMQGRNLG